MMRGALKGLAEGVADYTDKLITQELEEIRQQRLLMARAAFEDARYPVLRERAMQEQRDAWALEDERYPTLLQRKINERKALGIGQGGGGGAGEGGKAPKLYDLGEEIDPETNEKRKIKGVWDADQGAFVPVPMGALSMATGSAPSPSKEGSASSAKPRRILQSQVDALAESAINGKLPTKEDFDKYLISNGLTPDDKTSGMWQKAVDKRDTKEEREEALLNQDQIQNKRYWSGR